MNQNREGIVRRVVWAGAVTLLAVVTVAGTACVSPSPGTSGGEGGASGGAGAAGTGGVGGGATGAGGASVTGAGGTGGGGATGAGGTAGAGAGGAAGRDAGAATDAGATGDAGRAPDAAADAGAGPVDAMAAADTNRDVSAADRSGDAAGADARVDAGAATCNLAGAAGAQTPTIWVIGDSTASIYAANLAPRTGWAQPLQDYYAPACATVQDKALSGRNSKSFYDEGAWTPVRNALRAGDFVLIQFGHNDEKADDPLRFTDPFTTYEQYLSRYLDDTQAKGATPILLTSINRNDWSGNTLDDTHGNYPVAVRQLAQARRVALVDATALTKTYFERIGPTATAQLFLILAAGQSPNYPTGVVDNTHLQERGARTIAQIILADLARQGLPPGRLVKVVPQAP